MQICIISILKVKIDISRFTLNKTNFDCLHGNILEVIESFLSL